MESKPRAYLICVPNLRIHYARSLPFIFLLRPPAPVLGQSRGTHDARAQSHEASVCRCPCRLQMRAIFLQHMPQASHAQGWRRTTRRVSRSSSEVISSLLYLRPWFVSSNPVLAMASLRRWWVCLAHAHPFQLLINRLLILIYVQSSDSSFPTTNQLLYHLINYGRFQELEPIATVCSGHDER
jgi:hypothetical protein